MGGQENLVEVNGPNTMSQELSALLTSVLLFRYISNLMDTIQKTQG